jgi:hypothetical protein
MDETENLTITFRCPPELESALPRPIPAVQGIPEWFKTMPQRSFSTVSQDEQLTLKKCPPFIDAMTYGFLIPIDFHDNSQVTGSPFHVDDEVLLKFNGFWTIELPPGYSLLITHPINRLDLPFETLTGMVDADRYRDNFINFPARWRDRDFNGVLPKGTPLAQCVPIKRDEWTARFETIDGQAAERMQELKWTLANERDVYRRNFRAAKR